MHRFPNFSRSSSHEAIPIAVFSLPGSLLPKRDLHFALVAIYCQRMRWARLEIRRDGLALIVGALGCHHENLHLVFASGKLEICHLVHFHHVKNGMTLVVPV